MAKKRRAIPYAEVADFVRGWPTASGHGPALAKKYGIPVPSANRWIYETRRRGFLPPSDEPVPCPRCGGSGVVVRQWQRHHGAQSGADTQSDLPVRREAGQAPMPREAAEE